MLRILEQTLRQCGLENGEQVKNQENPFDYEQFCKNFNEITSQFDSIYSLIERKPLLAHYTSIQTLEKIIKASEVWFSNPLYMNDLEEVRFGMITGTAIFDENEPAVLKACGSESRLSLLKQAFHHHCNDFANDKAKDVYVFCLSEHDEKNADGLLSMWRGYGGQGVVAP